MNVIEECKISPPSGSVLPVSLPLTLFDAVWLPMPPIQRLFFFEHLSSKDHFANTILPNIKHSLSLALQQFFPLAGNLAWPLDSLRPEIHYRDGDSVSFAVAESDYNFDVLVSNDANNVGAFYPLVPQLINSPAEKRLPLIAFQVTSFPERGFSIGLTFSHVAADGRAIHHFIKTWASFCQTIQGVSSSCESESLHLQPPCISRSLVKEEPNNETDSAVLAYLRKSNIARGTFYTSKSNNHLFGTDQVFATFIMRPADINKIKQWVLENKEENAPLSHLSTFVLTCAYIWVCSVKEECCESVAVESEGDEMRHLLFPVDCRARLEPPLPVTYFGNCLRPTVVGAKVSDLIGEQGIPIAAELIGNAIQEIEEGNAILKNMEWVLSEFVLPAHVLTVAGSPKFRIYDTDFGWGKPKKTHVISIATTGAISLNESPSEVGAVEVSLARNKMEMDAFTTLYTSTMQGFSACN